jgi:hypothetical protein
MTVLVSILDMAVYEGILNEKAGTVPGRPPSWYIWNGRAEGDRACPAQLHSTSFRQAQFNLITYSARHIHRDNSIYKRWVVS